MTDAARSPSLFERGNSPNLIPVKTRIARRGGRSSRDSVRAVCAERRADDFVPPCRTILDKSKYRAERHGAEL